MATDSTPQSPARRWALTAEEALEAQKRATVTKLALQARREAEEEVRCARGAGDPALLAAAEARLAAATEAYRASLPKRP